MMRLAPENDQHGFREPADFMHKRAMDHL